MGNMINWFEIPVADMDRARKFYNALLDADLQVQDFKDTKMAFLPFGDEGVSGSLCWGEWYKPNQDGTLIYLNANPDLAVMLGRVEQAGGTVLVPKQEITPEYGYMALILDSEGNRIALHSNK